jgi:hypothetical protein
MQKCEKENNIWTHEGPIKKKIGTHEGPKVLKKMNDEHMKAHIYIYIMMMVIAMSQE